MAHLQIIYSSSCASDGQDGQDVQDPQDPQDPQDVNCHSEYNIDPTLRPEDSLNLQLRPDAL